MRKNLFLLVLAFLCLIVPNALAQDKTFDFVVAQDGSGDFRTVQAAINAVPALRKKFRTTILIKAGT